MRRDGSPAILSDGTAPPSETANSYVPTACPGGRAPHYWLPDGRSLYDLFGFEWTLLSFADSPQPSAGDVTIARVDDTVVRDLYGADYALIRPDQIVAWRGERAEEGLDALKALRG